MRPDQAIAMYQGDVFRDPVQYALQIGKMNQLMDGVKDYGTMTPVMPQLTSGHKSVAATTPDVPEAYVTLFINIKGR